MSAPPIPFLDLRPGADAAAVRAAIERVIARGHYVLGPEVEAFEAEFSAMSGGAHVVGVASGTDAIALLLRASDIGPGDEVIVPAITAAFTGMAVAATGATPRIVDVEPDTLLIDPAAVAAAVTPRTRAIVPVHLYGQPADLDALRLVADRHGLALIEDCCQAHLASARGGAVGTAGTGGAFSFYPTKNLGALGDAGAVMTRDAALAARVRRLRNGGQADRSQHVEIGLNSRLDEIQAAVLRARLPDLPGHTARRRELAAAYRRLLPAWVHPVAHREPGHVHHLFAMRSPQRDRLREHLRSRGIETLIHYPVSLSKQPAFARYHPGPAPMAERAAGELLSLPLHPALPESDVARVAEAVAAFAPGEP